MGCGGCGQRMNVQMQVELPTAPATALRLIHLCDDSKTDIKEIVQAISLDVALSAKLLQLANSAHFSQQYRVATLARAVTVLGRQYVKVVALSFHLAETSKQCTDLPIDLTLMWQAGVLRACLANQIARHTCVPAAQSKEHAFLIGILQDFALPFMASAVGPAYADMVEQGGMYTSTRTLAAEEDACETNHAIVAGRLFDLWRFPPLLTFAITNHHVTPQSVTPTDRALALWQIAYWVGAIPFSPQQPSASVNKELRSFAYAAFGLDNDSLGQTFYEAMDQYESLRPIFDGVLPKSTDAKAIMHNARALLTDKPFDGIADSMNEWDVR